jgi:predicted metal-dependent hydrolase
MISPEDFKDSVRDWAKEIGVTPKEIHFRKMKRKWASCSSKGRLSFSYDLLNEPLEVSTQAIVHELLHLKYPRHGKMFNLLLRTYLKNKGIEFDQRHELKR